jgi:hypothetical protein
VRLGAAAVRVGHVGAGVTVGLVCAAARSVVCGRAGAASARTPRVGVGVGVPGAGYPLAGGAGGGVAASPPAEARASAMPAARQANGSRRGTAASLPAEPLADKPAGRWAAAKSPICRTRPLNGWAFPRPQPRHGERPSAPAGGGVALRLAGYA